MNDMITILYVDDEPINLRLFSLSFKRKFNVLTADSGDHGLEMLKEQPFTKAVISDMKMPGMNGIEFIRLVKKDFPGISCFILTGYDINDEISEALREGLIHKYFRKPFNVMEIETAIREAIE
jgi:two-component system response regulator (stage 0 sporulation protein F)